MKWLADQVHGLGLKIGIYSSAGTLTCASYPASLGREQQDANLWASWGFDYRKQSLLFSIILVPSSDCMVHLSQVR